MNNYLIAFTVFSFIFIIATIEALYHWWMSTKSEDAKRITRRLKTISDNNKSKNESLLKHRYLNSSSPVDRFILGLPFSSHLDEFLAQSGKNWSAKYFIKQSIYATLIGFIVSIFFQLDLGILIGVSILSLFLPFIVVFRAREKRLKKIEEQLPEAIEAIARSLRSGHALSNALIMVSEEMPNPISSEFRITIEENNLGINLNDALQNMSRRLPITDFRYFIIAMLIQRETGGNLAEILNKISLTIRERFKLFAQIKVFTAEGRASAWVLGLLPFVIGAILSLINPGYLNPLFNDPIGNELLKVGFLVLLVGIFWMRSIIKVRI